MVSIASSLAAPDWASLFEAWWLLGYYHISLYWMSYEKLSMADDHVSLRQEYASALEEALRLERLAGYASRFHFLAITCLTRALALKKMLARRDISAQLQIGVKGSLAEIHAHAWVEVMGHAVGEVPDIRERFSVLRHPVV